MVSVIVPTGKGKDRLKDWQSKMRCVPLAAHARRCSEQKEVRVG